MSGGWRAEDAVERDLRARFRFTEARPEVALHLRASQFSKRCFSCMQIGMRLDQWLWAVRVFKTRTLAAEATKAGHVRINDQPFKRAR